MKEPENQTSDVKKQKKNTPSPEKNQHKTPTTNLTPKKKYNPTSQ